MRSHHRSSPGPERVRLIAELEDLQAVVAAVVDGDRAEEVVLDAERPVPLLIVMFGDISFVLGRQREAERICVRVLGRLSQPQGSPLRVMRLSRTM